jgi:hypothetical protein
MSRVRVRIQVLCRVLRVMLGIGRLLIRISGKMRGWRDSYVWTFTASSQQALSSDSGLLLCT